MSDDVVPADEGTEAPKPTTEQAGQALYNAFMGNADAGDNEANSKLVEEIVKYRRGK